MHLAQELLSNLVGGRRVKVRILIKKEQGHFPARL